MENQGRVNYGPGIHDRKGLLGRVLVNGRAPERWTSRALPLDDPAGLADVPFGAFDPAAPPVGPAFHRGYADVEEPADGFLALPGWPKGSVWINGFALGRYWSRGAQANLVRPRPGAAGGPQRGHRPRTARLGHPHGGAARPARPRRHRGLTRRPPRRGAGPGARPQGPGGPLGPLPDYQRTGSRSGSRFMNRVRQTSWSTGTASWRRGIFSRSTSMAISVCRLPRAVAGQ